MENEMNIKPTINTGGKDKILLFVIGLLLGAIISTGSIYIYTLTSNNSNSQTQQQMPGTPPNDSNGGMANGATPPAMPKEAE